MDGILVLADKERKASEPYKDMFKKVDPNNLEGTLRAIDSAMLKPVLDAHTALEVKGMKIGDEAFYFLLSLPLAAHLLEKKIQKEEGHTCSVDKVYYLLAQEFEKLLT